MTSKRKCFDANSSSTKISVAGQNVGGEKVVKLRRKGGVVLQGCDLYIGRRWTMGGWDLPASEWMNPFTTKKSGSAQAACDAFEQHMRAERPDLMARLEELKGLTLGCWCKPAPCHGDVLLKLMREQENASGVAESGKQSTPTSNTEPHQAARARGLFARCPEDLTRLFLTWLNAEELMCTLVVCRAWKSILKGDIVWRHVFLSDSEGFTRRMANVNTHRHLHLGVFDGDRDRTATALCPLARAWSCGCVLTPAFPASMDEAKQLLEEYDRLDSYKGKHADDVEEDEDGVEEEDEEGDDDEEEDDQKHVSAAKPTGTEMVHTERDFAVQRAGDLLYRNWMKKEVSKAQWDPSTLSAWDPHHFFHERNPTLFRTLNYQELYEEAELSDTFHRLRSLGRMATPTKDHTAEHTNWDLMLKERAVARHLGQSCHGLAIRPLVRVSSDDYESNLKWHALYLSGPGTLAAWAPTWKDVSGVVFERTSVAVRIAALFRGCFSVDARFVVHDITDNVHKIVSSDAVNRSVIFSVFPEFTNRKSDHWRRMRCDVLPILLRAAGPGRVWRAETRVSLSFDFSYSLHFYFVLRPDTGSLLGIFCRTTSFY